MRVLALLPPAILSIALLAAGAASAPPVAGIDWTKAERVEVMLSNFAFAPRSLHLKAGQPYVLHFTNAGSGGHNFSAPEFFASAQYPSGVGPDDGVVELHKGASADVSLVPVAGQYKLKCSHFLHATMGMTGDIVVE